MRYLLYTFAMAVAAPVVALFLFLHPRHRRLLGRFAVGAPQFSERPIWFHACSVGEVSVARSLVEAARLRWPSLPLVVSVSTVSGRDFAEKAIEGALVTWCPFDVPSVVRRFVAGMNPRVLALIETELWPGLVFETSKARIPVTLVNGRISDKHFGRYGKTLGLTAEVLGRLERAGMQNEAYRDRIVHLGAPEDIVEVTGNMKFDSVCTEVEPEGAARLRERLGFSENGLVVVFGSTRPGDEALARRCWDELSSRYASLCFVVAPRHTTRIREAAAPFDGVCVLRSELEGRGGLGDARVIVLDTMGELVDFYALASVAVVGGSFYAGVDGHNPLEPAGLGVPTVFGPFMANFSDPARILCEGGGGKQVLGPEDLAGVLDELLGDDGLRKTMGRAAREAVLDNQGAIERNLALIESVLA